MDVAGYGASALKPQGKTETHSGEHGPYNLPTDPHGGPLKTEAFQNRFGVGSQRWRVQTRIRRGLRKMHGMAH